MPIKVSFFSYKGGAGRTTSTLNTSYYLVTEVLHPTRDYPLLIIDADTESAGISYLLTKKMNTEFIDSKSLQGLCQAAKAAGNAYFPSSKSNDIFAANRDVLSKFIPVGDQFGVDPNAVLLLRSNVSGFNYSTDEYVNPLEKFVDWAYKTCRCSIIFDTPSGTQALTRCSLRNSDIIVCHMRPTTQFQEGTKDYLQDYLKRNDTIDKTIVLCPSVVPLDPVMIGEDRYPDVYHERLNAFVDKMKEIADEDEVKLIDLMTKPTPVDFYLREFASDLSGYHQKKVVGIPEITRFKWNEGLLPVVPDLSVEEKLACERYYYLANIIAGRAQ